MEERTGILAKALERYGIGRSLPDGQILALLEKEHQKLLRKLNHVFGNAAKEMELEQELDELEAAMEELERTAGRKLSLDDVELEMKTLSQTQVAFDGDAQTEEEQEEAAVAEMMEIRRLEKLVMKDHGKNIDVSFRGILRLLDYYERKGSFLGREKWLAYIIEWFHYPQHTNEMYDLQRTRTDGLADPEKCRYWMRRAAKTGHKDACFEMGKECMKEGSPSFDLKQAAVYFAKAADREHLQAYLYAFTAFYKLEDYNRAETCLKAADKIGVPGAAYRLGVVYDVDENSYGQRNPEEALAWYEKAYRQSPDGDVCYGLGVLYDESGRAQEAEEVLLRGIREYGSEDCEEAWEDLRRRLQKEAQEETEAELEEEAEAEPEEEAGRLEEETEPPLSPKRDARPDLIKQATALYEQGNYSRAALVFLKLKGEYELEGEYRAALCYLKEKGRASRMLAKAWLKSLAKENYKDAGDIYEREFGAQKRKK